MQEVYYDLNNNSLKLSSGIKIMINLKSLLLKKVYKLKEKHLK